MSDQDQHHKGYAVEMLHISKSFGALRALDDVSIQVKYGEVHAILGENGAGKSTLMSILFGLRHADSGVIKVENREVDIANPRDAATLKIGMVHQHFKLVDVFSVLDNIILGHETQKLGFLSKRKELDSVQQVLDRFGISLDLKAKVKDIPVAAQQKTEIVKVLYLNAKIIILDEPTAVLTPQEIETLMGIIRNFAKQGKAVILITHKLNEIKQVADRVTILRRGQSLGTFQVKDTTPSQLAELMVGKKVNFETEKSDLDPGVPVLEIKDLSCLSKDRTRKALDGISITVREHEVAAIAAIEGNGQEELVNIVSGLESYPRQKGSVILHDEQGKATDLTDASVKKHIEASVSHIPSDRQRYGLFLDYNIEQNLISRSLEPPFTDKVGFMKQRKIHENAVELSKRFDIRSSAGTKTRTGDMSGGNQQKVIIARELSHTPRLLISDQATRGLDVGAIEFVNEQVIAARDAGAGVLLYSTELEDIFNLATVIYVMHEGKIVATLDPKKTNFKEVGYFMAGGEEKRPLAEEIQPTAIGTSAGRYTGGALIEHLMEEENISFVEAKPLGLSLAKSLAKEDVSTMIRFPVKSFQEGKKLGRQLVKDIKALRKISGEQKAAVTIDEPLPTLSIVETIAKDQAQNREKAIQAESRETAQKKDRRHWYQSGGLVGGLNSLVAIAIGLILGFIVMLGVNPGNAPEGLGRLFISSFNEGTISIGRTLWRSAPLIILGLCVALPSKAGIFNIGASGQFTAGAVTGFLVANFFPAAARGDHLFWIVLLAGMAGGALWATIPGLLKAYLNVNEVVSTIMMNWIIVFVSMIVVMMPQVYYPERTAANYAIPGANVPTAGMDAIFGASSRVDSGILFAVVLAILCYVLVRFTRYGYKLKAAGLSKDASKYAGFNGKSITVSSMAIAGALAGIASILYYFPPVPQDYLQPLASVTNMGFDGISVSLIANSNPIATIFSGLFLSVLRYASEPLQLLGYEKNVVDIIMGVIIYSIAAVKLVSLLANRLAVKYAIKHASLSKAE